MGTTFECVYEILQDFLRMLLIVRSSFAENFERIEHIKNQVELRQGDLLDISSMISILEAIQPDEFYNLAAQSFVQ